MDGSECRNVTEILFQHIQPHFTLQIQLALNSGFPNQWTGTSGPWPPKSPDLTSLSFVLCEYIW